MIKKRGHFAVIILALFCALLIKGAVNPVDAQAASSYTEITVSTYSELKEALDTAEAATQSAPYKIIIEAGTYTVPAQTSLYIPGNTYIYCEDGAVIMQESSDSDPGTLVKIGDDADDCSSAEGYEFENITIEGGTWDKNGNEDTLLMLCHGSNITIKDATFTNSHNGHLMEVAGVDGLTIENCIFSDMTLDNDDNTIMSYEAIQLDILQSDHISGYSQEDLANQDIVIDGCTFSDVPRGIGSHTATLNNPINGLEITDCTFTDNASCAIQIMNVKNCTISGNTVTGTPRGIFIYTYKNNNCYLATTLESGTDTSVSYKTPSSSNIVIEDNTIILSGTDKYEDGAYKNTGIYVGGVNLTSYTASSGDKLPSGNYYIKGVTISNNTIKTNGHGIRLADARGTTVSGNKVYYTGSASNSYYGISASDASKGIDSEIAITGNYIYTKSGTSDSTYKFQRGIAVYGSSSVASITGNYIYGSKESGIWVYSSSNAASIKSNTIKNSDKNGIMLSTKSKSTYISSNKVSSAGNNAIYLYSGCTAKYINSNTITSAGNNAIYLYSGCTGTNIKSNTISSAGKNGIYIYSSSGADSSIQNNTITSPGNMGIDITSSTVRYIQKNTISKSAASAIRIYNAKVTGNINTNTITSPKAHGIYVYSNGTTTTVGAISSNEITSAATNGIYVLGSSKKPKVTTISSNTISSAGKYGIGVDYATVTNIKSNTISSPSKYGITVLDSGTATTISGNTITSAGSYGINIKSVKNAMKISSNTIEECSGYSIYLCPNSTSYRITVSSNTITGKSKKYDGIYVTEAKATIQSNTIKSCKYAVNCTTTAYANIYKNTMSSNTYNKYKIGSKTSGNVSTPTLTMSTKKKTSLKMTWTKVSGSGYLIYRSTSKSGTYSKIKTISSASTLSYTNTGLKKSTTYYYKVRAYKKISNTTIYGSYSSIKSAKTKSS